MSQPFAVFPGIARWELALDMARISDVVSSFAGVMYQNLRRTAHREWVPSRGKGEDERPRVKITGCSEGSLLVSVTAPSAKGKANDEVCALIADVLGLPKSRVAVTRGATRRVKRVDVTGMYALVGLKRLGAYAFGEKP